MSEIGVNLYEGMFLLHQQAVSSDFAGCVDFLKQVFERAEAELIVLRRWDERRLAYAIKGQRRGTFMLTYFRARSTQIANIERDCNLSEQVLRNMILRADHLGETELELAGKDADLSLEMALRGGDDEPDENRDDAAGGANPAAAAVDEQKTGEAP